MYISLSLYFGYFLTLHFFPLLCICHISFSGDCCDLGTRRRMCQFTTQFIIAFGTLFLGHGELESWTFLLF